MGSKRILFILIAIAILSLCLAWVSTGHFSFREWGSFLAVTGLGGGILSLGWRTMRSESLPGWLGRVMIGAVLFRLIVGVFWFTTLPRWGHGTDGELAGYVMSDAYRRDTAAWELAQSGKPLIEAFKDYRFVDQYGGFLFISSVVYRWLGGSSHKPLVMVVLSASLSGLSIPYLWGYTRRLWGDTAAQVAAWILFLYPEAVLLGSSQMREAFLMTFTCIALYGLLVYWQDRKLSGILGMVGVLLLCLPISPLFTLFLLGVVIAITLMLNRFQILKNWSTWLIFGCLMFVVVGGVWLLGDRIYPNGASNPITLIRDWFMYAAKWEERAAGIQSGWMDKIFQRSPDWMNPWIILGYGTVQPFLPAALIATGNWMWRMIAIWRSIGWTLLLILLLYSPIRAVQNIRKQYIAVGFSVLVWAVILTSAYRSAGDQWDNPRYRVVFVGLQVALAGWVWTEQRRSHDPWLRRIFVGIGWVFAWFTPWYLRRYSPTFTWPVVDLFKTVTLGLVSAFLYWIWDWAREKEIHLKDGTKE
jgi:hypothetical protein